LIITGAGQAGLALAKELSETDFKILVLDRKKASVDVAYQTLGSFIDPELWSIPREIFNPVNTLYFNSKSHSIIKKGFSTVINREKLLEHMEHEAMKNPNITIQYRANIESVAMDEGGIKSITYSVKNKHLCTVQGQLFVDCSGCGAVLRKKSGLSHIYDQDLSKALGFEMLVPLQCESHTADIFIGSNLPGGYGWIFPRDEETAIIGCGTLIKNYFPKIKDMLSGMWNLDRVKKRCKMKPYQVHRAILFTGTPGRSLVWKNLLLIGDTALQAHPLVGEGVRFIMDAARMAAKSIKKVLSTGSLKWLNRYQKEWIKKYNLIYKRGYKIQQKLKVLTADDEAANKLVKRLEQLKDKDFVRLIGGDLRNDLLLKIVGLSHIFKYYRI